MTSVLRVLMLQHVPYEGEGYIADYLQEHRIPYDVIRLWEPYVLPDMRQYSSLIIMGGPMGVYEEFPSKHDEVTLIKTAFGAVPMLGFCLGSQLIAHALGARVYPNVHNGKPAKEIGYYTVRLTPDGQAHPLFKGFEADVRVFEWHGDAFDLPSDASLLATSPVCRHQAFACRNAYGLLFHLELTPEMIRGIAEENRAWSHERFDLDEAKMEREAKELAPLMKRQCYQILENFFSASK